MSSASSTRAPTSAFGTPRIASPKRDVARARSCAETARSSGTPCRSRAPPAGGCRCACRPARCCPPVRGSRPARQFSAVDLPQPDGPSRAMNSPRRDRQVDVLERVERCRSRGSTPSSRSSGSRSADRHAGRSPWSGQATRAARSARPVAPSAYFFFCGADLLVPAAEGGDEACRLERQLGAGCRR